MMRFPCVACLVFLFAGPAMAQPVPPPSVQCKSGNPRVMAVPETRSQPPFQTLPRGSGGSVEMLVMVEPDGVPSNVTVRSSSGSAALNDIAMAHVRNVWRWQPTRCAHALVVPVRMSYNMRAAGQDPGVTALGVDATQFITADAGDHPTAFTSERAVVMLAAAIRPDGSLKLQMTRTIMGGANAAREEASRQILQRRKWTAPMLDGVTIGGVIFVGVIWVPPGETAPNLDALKAVMSKSLLGAAP